MLKVKPTHEFIKLTSFDETKNLPTFSKVLGVQDFNQNMLVRDKDEIQQMDFDMITYYWIKTIY